MSTYTHIYMHAYTSVYMNRCAYVCIYTYMYICITLYIYVADCRPMAVSMLSFLDAHRRGWHQISKSMNLF